jgi:hypothetical protein
MEIHMSEAFTFFEKIGKKNDDVPRVLTHNPLLPFSLSFPSHYTDTHIYVFPLPAKGSTLVVSVKNKHKKE